MEANIKEQTRQKIGEINSSVVVVLVVVVVVVVVAVVVVVVVDPGFSWWHGSQDRGANSPEDWWNQLECSDEQGESNAATHEARLWY